MVVVRRARSRGSVVAQYFVSGCYSPELRLLLSSSMPVRGTRLWAEAEYLLRHGSIGQGGACGDGWSLEVPGATIQGSIYA